MTTLDLPRSDTPTPARPDALPPARPDAPTSARPDAPTSARPDTTILARRVREMIAGGRPGAARPLIAALRRLNAADPQLPELEARLKLREGDAAGARRVLDAVLDAQPPTEDDGSDTAAAVAAATLHKLRVEARTALDDHVGACQDAAEAVVLDRHDAEAKALLGLTLLQLGHAKDALPCLVEATRDQPANPSMRLGLAEAQERLGDHDAALETLAEGARRLPGHAGLRNAALLLRIKLGRCEEALADAQAARRDGAADACTFGLLGHALSKLHRHEDATAAYADALKLAPEDPYVRHLAAAGGRVAASERAPVEYVRTLFDGYAGRFEEHLVSLGYRVPGLVRGVLERWLPGLPGIGEEARLGPVLDLGCGTGLLALVCMDLPLGPWIGVDASGKMLAGAREKGLYAELAEDDLVRFLDADQRTYPVILAGDVLCYFGKLEPVFGAIARRLAPGGLFICSLERHSDDAAVQLGPTGRWAHGEAHLREAADAAGLRCRTLAHEELRVEGGTPVQGVLAVLERSDEQPRANLD